ncbi:hypothetical protein C0995_011530 [Termitomyces sp. Mi166|nr:hypothetical protein C0995_011530 [Termitomyces sp. Mi166\
MLSNKQRHVPRPMVEEYLKGEDEIISLGVELACHLDLTAFVHGFSWQTIMEVTLTQLEPPLPPAPALYAWNTKNSVISDSDMNELFFYNLLDLHIEHDPVISTEELVKRQQTIAMDNPLCQWTPDIDTYVHEF